jgi:hypothetical protein
MEWDISGVKKYWPDLEKGVIECSLSEVALVGVNLLHGGWAVDRNAVGRNLNKLAVLVVKGHHSFGSPSVSALFGEPKWR